MILRSVEFIKVYWQTWIVALGPLIFCPLLFCGADTLQVGTVIIAFIFNEFIHRRRKH